MGQTADRQKTQTDRQAGRQVSKQSKANRQVGNRQTGGQMTRQTDKMPGMQESRQTDGQTDRHDG